jgi:hypothetical protein
VDTRVSPHVKVVAVKKQSIPVLPYLFGLLILLHPLPLHAGMADSTPVPTPPLPVMRMPEEANAAPIDLRRRLDDPMGTQFKTEGMDSQRCVSKVILSTFRSPSILGTSARLPRLSKQ